MNHPYASDSPMTVTGTILSGSVTPVRLGSGVVTGVLGEGGMAVVYEIWNEELGVKRAVKLLRPDCTPEHRDRFNTEIKVSAQLDHANVIRIHSVGEWNGLPFIEMEKIDGVSLAQLLEDRGALPIETSLAIALIISRALNYTHHHQYEIYGQPRTGILHRDLKPANILISKRGVVRLTDFGIATPVNVSIHTPDGNIVGSLQYIAPEQLKAEEIDCRADIYSFGCVVYEMLTGLKAFPNKTVASLVHKRLTNHYERIEGYALNAPHKLKRLVTRCMARDFRKRPSDMCEISKELGKLFEAASRVSPETVVQRYIERADRDSLAAHPRLRSGWIKVAAFAAVILCALFIGLSMGDNLFPRGKGADASVKTPASDFGSFQAVVVSAAGRGGPSRPPAPQTISRATGEISGGRSILSSMKQEDAQMHYANVMELCSHLPLSVSRALPAVIYQVRALRNLSGLSEQFFETHSVDDAEYYLGYADFLRTEGRFDDAQVMAERALAAPVHCAEAARIRREALLCKARCLTCQFDRLPDSHIGAAARECWRKVEIIYRGENDLHGARQEAQDNFRRLAGT